ncbi:MAG: hypothetical protein ACREE2_17680 [Stellaceae bacterium]
MIGTGAEGFGCERGGETAIAEFIKTRGVTRCPTACVLPTQGLVGAADRAQLQEYAATRDRVRQARAAARQRPFAPFEASRSRAG